MKKILMCVFLSCFVSFSGFAKGKIKFGERFDFGNEKVMKVSNEKSGDTSTSWDATLEICWKNKRVVKCDKDSARQKFVFSCWRSRSAMAMFNNCEMKGNKRLSGMDNIIVMKGVHRDFLVFRKQSGDATAQNYSYAIVDEKTSTWCDMEKLVGSDHPQEKLNDKVDTLTERLQSKPWEFIKWTKKSCEFKFTRKQKILIHQSFTRTEVPDDSKFDEEGVLKDEFFDKYNRN